MNIASVTVQPLNHLTSDGQLRWVCPKRWPRIIPWPLDMHPRPILGRFEAEPSAIWQPGIEQSGFDRSEREGTG
jgi:hypothetical protein